MEGGGYNLLLPFDCEDEKFARGFEAGRVWDILGHALAADDLPTETVTVHGTNAEMLCRMAEAQEVRLEWVELDDTWAEATFHRGEDV